MASEAWPGYDQPTVLYRYFDAEGVLLYVGVSNEFPRRNRTHLKNAPFRSLAAFVRMEVYPTRQIAEIAEDFAIDHEKPKCNVKAITPVHPAGHKRDWYLHKMGGLRGEFVKWATTAKSWPFGLLLCDTPGWFDEGRIFSWVYCGKKPKWFPKPAPPEPPSEADKIVWGPR